MKQTLNKIYNLLCDKLHRHYHPPVKLKFKSELPKSDMKPGKVVSIYSEQDIKEIRDEIVEDIEKSHKAGMMTPGEAVVLVQDIINKYINHENNKNNNKQLPQIKGRKP